MDIQAAFEIESKLRVISIEENEHNTYSLEKISGDGWTAVKKGEPDEGDENAN